METTAWSGKPAAIMGASLAAIGTARAQATLDGHGEKVHNHFFAQSSFATYALANKRNVVKVGRDVPLDASVRSAAVFRPEPGP
jgi:Zn-dependent alcohol dehydrogenase